MTQEEKLDEALKGTFPASDAFYLSPDGSDSAANEQMRAQNQDARPRSVSFATSRRGGSTA